MLRAVSMFTTLLVFFLCLLFGSQQIQAQAPAGTAVGIICPASGSSIEVQPITQSRVSIAILNDSAIDVRIGYVASGTPNLDDTNSFIVKTGVNYADSVPGVYLGRFVCMSTTASTATIHVSQTTRY